MRPNQEVLPFMKMTPCIKNTILSSGNLMKSFTMVLMSLVLQELLQTMEQYSLQILMDKHQHLFLV